MQRDKTNTLLVGGQWVPPLPTPTTERKVYSSAVPLASSLRYVFELVMSGTRGSIGWDEEENHLLLYLKTTEEDYNRHYDLAPGVEVWAAFHVREDM